MTKVDVRPDVLKWAAVRSGKSEYIQNDFPQWEKWIKNEKQPTFKQLEKLSKATSTPLGYFFLDQPPVEELPIPHYRTINDQDKPAPSPDLLETVQTIERRQEWMREYLLNQGYEPLSFVGRRKVSDDPHLVATEIRRELGLQNGWAATCRTWQDALRMLLQKIEAIRVMVVVNGIVGNNTHRKLDVDEFRGFVLADEYAPFVFVNGSDGKAAQMFTLAHELAHIWYGHSAAFDLQKLHPAQHDIERVCNLTAAEFLIPKTELQELWPSLKNEPERYQKIARQFKVSELVATRRALDLGFISKQEFFEFYQDRMNREVQTDQRDSGGNFYATQAFRVGRRFGEAVIRATLEGKLLYSEAYRLTGLKGKTFSEFAERLGFGGGV